MDFVIGWVSGSIVLITLWIIFRRFDVDGIIKVYKTEDGTYPVLEIKSFDVLEQNYVFLKVDHINKSH